MSESKWVDAQDACYAAFKANINLEPEKVLPDIPPEDFAYGLVNWGAAWAKASNSESYYAGVVTELAPYRKKLGCAKLSDVYFQIGRLSLLLGNFQDAIQFHKLALSLRVKQFGFLHASTADSQAAVGQVMLCQGQLPGAEECERRALSVRQTLFEAGYPDLAKSFLGIGLVLEAQGRQEEALNSYWQAFHNCGTAIAVSKSETSRQALKRCAGTEQPWQPGAVLSGVEEMQVRD